jgi:hypothetical protein
MDANTVALSLIQKWVGPDDKIADMSAFYDALVKAITDAHKEGEDERPRRRSAELETAGQRALAKYKGSAAIAAA